MPHSNQERTGNCAVITEVEAFHMEMVDKCAPCQICIAPPDVSLGASAALSSSFTRRWWSTCTRLMMYGGCLSLLHTSQIWPNQTSAICALRALNEGAATQQYLSDALCTESKCCKPFRKVYTYWQITAGKDRPPCSNMLIPECTAGGLLVQNAAAAEAARGDWAEQVAMCGALPAARYVKPYITAGIVACHKLQVQGGALKAGGAYITCCLSTLSIVWRRWCLPRLWCRPRL